METTESFAIEINNLEVDYGSIPALSKICLKVKPGEFLGIIGPNGGGKSTLLKSILGLQPPSSGEVLLFGKPPKKNRSLAGYVPQVSSVDRGFPITLFEVILSGRLKPSPVPFFRYSAEDIEAVRDIIDRIGLSGLSDRRVSELSGGQFQKMLIARALVTEPKLLLLDEPTANVDAASGDQIFSLLEELNKRITILLVTHDLMAISSRISSLACLNRTLIYHGEPELNSNIVSSLYGCPVDLIAHGVPHRVLKEHDHK